MSKSRLHFLEFSINRAANHSLTERFQTWHNIKITELTLAVVKFNFAFFIINSLLVIAFIYIISSISYEHLMLINFLQFVYLFVSMNSCLYPYVCFKNNERLNEKMVKIFRIIRSKFGYHKISKVVDIGSSPIPQSSKPSHHLSPEQHSDILERTWLNIKQQMHMKNENVKYKSALKFQTEKIAIVASSTVRQDNMVHFTVM